MTNKTKILNLIISLILPIGALIGTLVYIKNTFVFEFFPVFLFSALGIFFFAIFNVVVHELGHILFGKFTGFSLISFTLFFCKWTFNTRGATFNFVKLDEALGYTEMIPKNTDNIEKRLKIMTLGGALMSIILFLLSCVPFIFAKNFDMRLFCFLSFCMPVSLYSFLNNLLPMQSNGARNDGAVIRGIRLNDDVSKVVINLQKIESELFNGKTPCEINEKLYFDLPQLPEDSPYFISLLTAKLYFFIDKNDFENANKTLTRLESLSSYLPKSYNNVINSYRLYACCTYSLNETLADNLVAELEKFLNKDNGIVNLLSKSAYISLIGESLGEFDKFYDKGVRDSLKQKIKGLGLFYKKEFDKLNDKFYNLNNG